MITQKQLMSALNNIMPWHYRATDWRKVSGGKVVRFVNWAWKHPVHEKRKAVR